MKIYRTKLFELNGNEDIPMDVVAKDVKSYYLSKINDESTIYGTVSEDGCYFVDIATNIKIPMIHGFSVYKSDEYYWIRNIYQSYPSVVATSKATQIERLYYGACCLERYEELADTHEILEYYFKYHNNPERKDYLLDKVQQNIYYSHIKNKSIYEEKDIERYIKKLIISSFSLIDSEYKNKFIYKKKYFVDTKIVKEGMLPISISCDSIIDFGKNIIKKAELIDFDKSYQREYLIRKIMVTPTKSGILKEIRTNCDIPIAYYKFDNETNTANLMINNRPAKEGEKIVFFIDVNGEYKEGTKQEIKDYKNKYVDRPRLAKEYSEKNNISDSLGFVSQEELEKQEQPKKKEETTKKEQQNQLTPPTIPEDIFKDLTIQALNERKIIRNSTLLSNIKDEQEEKLNKIIDNYDSMISKDNNQILQLYNEATCRNEFICALSQLEIDTTSKESESKRNLTFIDNYLDYLQLSAETKEKNVQNIYSFLTHFNNKVMDRNYNLLDIIKAQNKIYSQLLSSLIPLDYLDKKRNILLFDDMTISNIATLIDNNIDSIPTENENSTIAELRILNEKKANSFQNDADFLREYILNTTTLYNTLEENKVRRK